MADSLFYWIKELVHFLIVPFNTFWVLLATALVLKLFNHKSKWALRLNIIAVLIILWCSLPVTSNWMLSPLENRYPVVKEDDPIWKRADVIVVLGCRHYEQPNSAFADQWHACSLARNLQAAIMYREYNIPIIVSGGLLANQQLTEAEANRYFLLKLGIPAEKIVMSPLGLNTQQETAALRALLYGKTVALVTSASHQLRAKRYLELQSVRVIPIPVDFLSKNGDLWAGPDLKSLARSHRAFYEWLGLAQQYFSVHL